MQYLGWTVGEIKNRLEIQFKKHPKNYAAYVIRKAVGITKEGNLYIQNKNAKMKVFTYRCLPGLKVKETISIGGYRYNEIINQKWENSELKINISNFILLVLELPNTKAKQEEAIFKTVLFHKPTGTDMDKIREDWSDIVDYIKTKKADDLDASVGGRIIQTRPKAADGDDKVLAPGNQRTVKRGFFIKTNYIQNILDNYKENTEFCNPSIAYDIGETKKNRRVKTNVLRVIRDTKISAKLKEEYDYKCQICGNRIYLKNGNHIRYYVEAHHLKPFAQIHNGPDIEENIIILCPNHHVEFDYGTIAIDPNDFCTILHKNNKNPYIGKQIEIRHKIGKEFIKYHYNIFRGDIKTTDEKITEYLGSSS